VVIVELSFFFFFFFFFFSVCFIYCCLAVVVVHLCVWDCDTFILFCLCRFYSFAHRVGFWVCVGMLCILVVVWVVSWGCGFVMYNFSY